METDGSLMPFINCTIRSKLKIGHGKDLVKRTLLKSKFSFLNLPLTSVYENAALCVVTEYQELYAAQFFTIKV